MAACIIALLCHASIGGLTALADCQPNPTGLIGWWAGDGNASNILGTNNGTLQGGATANAVGRVGMAFTFDGTNNFVQIPDSAILRPTNLTIEAWVRFNGLDTPGTAEVGRQYLIFKQNSANADFEGYDLSKIRVTGGDVFEFRVSTASGQSVAVTSTTLIATGAWYHVAAARGSNFLQIYVNGQLQRQTNAAFAQNYGTLPLHFGSSGQAFWDRKFRGTLDEVALYNRALSSNEIAAIYNVGTGGKCKEVIITTPPLNQSAQVGSNVNFSVAATGFGTLRYRWLFNAGTISGATNATFTLANAEPSNAGSYSVAVSNTLGAITSAPAVLTISTPPVITNAPLSQTVVVGGSANFSVGAGGSAPLYYQWRKASIPLIGQTSATLSLSNVSINDAGNYDVVVTNLVGTVTSAPPATLTVNVPPFVTLAPQSQTTIAGSNVNFFVVAGGTLPLSYQWRKNGLPLAGQTSVNLAISIVTTSDAGSYDVVVANVAGAVTSTPPATLTVNVPPFISASPQSQTVVVGTNVSFSVSAGGTMPLTYAWQKNGIPLNGQTSESLTLTSVTTNDSGSYTVVITNVAGALTSSPPATLTVNVPPFISGAPQSQTVVLGSNVNFTVVAGGTAPLNYQWRKDGSVLSGQTGTSLVLSAVSTNDAGSYQVVVSNVAGMITSTPPATLTVNIPPFITGIPQSQTVAETSSVGFTVGAGGTLPLSYQWRKSGLPLSGQTGTTLQLASVTMADAGSYDVVVTNVAGSAISTPPAILTITSAASGYPTITNPPRNQLAVQGAAVTFTVGVSGSMPLHYQWRKYGSNLADEVNVTLMLSSVAASDAGDYDVVVTNSVGTVTSTPPAALTIIPPVVFKPSITDQPQSLRVGVGTSAIFTVGAGGTTPLNYQWRKGNSPIEGQTSSTLILSNVSTNNDGNYDVIVSNIAGSVTSVVASLSVKLVVDPELEKAIVCAATNQSGTLTATDLQSLTRLSIRNRGITNLFGLQYAVNLASLDASQNRISDLAPLQGLVRLSSFELDDNRGDITTLSPLAGLTNLSCLVIGQVYVTSYASLSGLTNLTSLVLRKGNVAGLIFLQNLRRLSSLSLSQNTVRSLNALAGLTNLSQLDVSWNPTLTNYSALQAGLSNLVDLHIAGNAIATPPSFQGLNRLRLLDLGDNNIEIPPTLAGLVNLNYLVLSRNPLADYSGLSSLGNLTGVELSGNAISNVAFLSDLKKLGFADLSYNHISDLTPLSGLTNLQGLVLTGNRLNSFAPLSGMSNLSNLWVQNCSITNAAFLSGLPGLRHLNLDENFISDVSPVLGLTNLTGLGLSRNPAANVLSISGLVNLRGLRLEGNSLTEVSALTNLFRLTYLSLHQNRLTNGSPLGSLTNLQNQYVGQNRIRDISYLQSLPRSASLDLELNLLNPTNATSELSVIEGLHCQPTHIPQCACALPTNAPPGRGVDVSYLTQHTSPKILAPAKWFIPWNTTSILAFSVWYDLNFADPLPVTANSSNPVLIENGSLSFSTFNYHRSLMAEPKPGQTGDVNITLTVRNEGGLTTSTGIQVSVLVPIDITNMVPAGVPVDPELEFAFRQASGKYEGELTSVDLLNITRLSAQNANFTGFSGWQWLTNLTTLYLNGDSGGLEFLTNLTQLTSLHLYDPVASELTKLAVLTNVTELELTGPTISNLSFVVPIVSLKSLILSRTRVGDVSPLSALTNLNQVRLQRNMLTNILGLYTLPKLTYVDVRYNLLDTSEGSLPLAVVLGLEARGVPTDYLPQRAPPVIDIAHLWNISGDRTSILSFNIFENGELAYDVAGVGGSSSNLSLLPNANIHVGVDTNSSILEWALTVSPLVGQSGSTSITIAVTNDVGLNSSTSLVVTVASPQDLNGDFFGMSDLTWQVGGAVGWFGQSAISAGGFPAAQAGGITHGQTSILESTIIGPGTLRFWWKVSSEAEYDWLIFESSEQTNQISGEVDWAEQVVSIAPRSQTVRWRYAKDLNAAGGMDAGWVAHVSFVPATWLDLVGIPTNSQCHIALYGVPGQEYAMEISTNAINWFQLGTVLSTNRITPFVDAAATNAVRFYRARAILDAPTLGLSDQTEAGFGLSWPGMGVLESSPTPNGPWEEVGGISPFYVSTEVAPAQFFRVKVVGD